jgi:hypothetical protein
VKIKGNLPLPLLVPPRLPLLVLIRTHHYVQQNRSKSQETSAFYLASVLQIDSKKFIVQQKSYQGLLNT